MIGKKLVNLVIEKEQKLEGVLRKSSTGRKVLQRYLGAKYRLVKAPRRMFLEPTSICNFKCPKCPYPQMTRPGDYIDLEKYEQFLRRWAADIEPFEVIEFTGGGEVLVFKQFAELVRLTREIMPATKLMTTSNLSILKREKAKELLQAGLRYWQVSLDSIDDAEFKQMIGTKNFTVEKIISNLKMLWECMQEDPSEKNHIEVLAHRPYDADYEKKTDEIAAAVRPYCHGVGKSPYQSLMGRKTEPLYQLAEKRLYNNTVLLPCSYVWEDLTVVCDGTVRVCCSDMFDSEVSFGNVFTDSPREIVENLQRREYQAKMLAGRWDELYLCKNCHAPRA